MRQVLNVPNLLTCARIVLTPVIAVSIVQHECIRAFWFSLIAGLTDAADGYFARLLGETSRFGAYLDAIADKLLLTSIYVCFGVAGLVPWWIVYLVVGRDLMILSLVGGGLWKGIRDFPPSIWGKISTVLQIAASLAVISECAYGLSRSAVDALLHTVAAATFWSGLDYVRRAVRSIHYGSR